MGSRPLDGLSIAKSENPFAEDRRLLLRRINFYVDESKGSRPLDGFKGDSARWKVWTCESKLFFI